jgi:hypothetical protein
MSRRRLTLAIVVTLATAAVAGCQGARPSAEPASLAAGWTRRAPAPLALTEVAVAAHDGRIWMAGGLDADGNAVSDVFLFDPRRDTWVAGPRLPEAIHHAALASDGDALWLMGGYVGDGFGRPTAAVRVWQGDAWSNGIGLPDPRAAGAAAWDGGGRLVFAGGVGSGGIASTVWAQTDHGWEDSGRLPEGLEHLAATSDGAGSVFILGGRRGGLDANRASVTLLEAGGARHLGDLPTPRGGVAAFWWPDLGACLVGGESPGGTNPQVECIAPSGTLAALPDLPTPRHGLGAAVVDGAVYVIGGGTQPGLFVSDTVEALTLP